MRIRRFFSLFLPFTLLLTFCSIVPAHAASVWSIQTIDEKAANGGGIIAIDSNNNPHIAYTNFENGDYRKNEYPMYASWNGSSWNLQTVASAGVVYDYALDTNDNPHMLLGNMGTTGLQYANWNGSNWSIQTITNEGLTGSLALDSAGNPHTAYITNNNVLNYASWTGSSWSIQTVDSDISNVYHEYHISNKYPVSLALDAKSNPTIMYQGAPETVKYATRNDAKWNIQTVLDNASFGKMVLDSAGYPHFVYRNIVQQDWPRYDCTLIYARWNGLAWNSRTVVSSLYRYDTDLGSLTLDAQNHPHIALYNGSGRNNDGSLMYARWTGTAWNIQNVNSFATGSGSIALDSNGNPYISYPGTHNAVIWLTAYLMYAKTTESTTTSALPTVEFALLIAIPVVTLVLAGVYLWKRKTQKNSRQMPA